MATPNLENQLQSAQKNLLFLQREHANTLKGLHAEIRRLQQHCTGSCGGTRVRVLLARIE